MKIYNNKLGDCSGLAIANAINERFDVSIPQIEVERLYKRNNWTNRGARLQDILNVLQFKDSLYGFKVKSYRIVFFDGSPKNPAYELRRVMGNPDTDLLMSLWMRKRPRGHKSKIRYDGNYNFVPYETDKVSTHGLYVKEYDFMNDRHIPIGVRVVNNWGKDWGYAGSFFMNFQQFHTEVCQLFEVEFQPI